MDEVTSTLDVARELAAQYPGPTWFTAKRQTAARGRRGRAWIAPEGNFYGTLAMACTDPSKAALRSFVAALALHEVICDIVGPHATVRLKWPNDVLIDGGKVAGILLEGLMAGGRSWGLAIGIGVNLTQAPSPDQIEPGAVRPVSIQSITQLSISPDQFLSRLAPAFARWDHRLETTGFAPLRTAWLKNAAKLGEVITARLPQEEVTGTFETLSDMGYLILNTAKGRRQITAADVFF